MTWTRRTRIRFPSMTLRKCVRTPRAWTTLNQWADVRHSVSPLYGMRVGITLSNTLIWSVKTYSSSPSETSYTSFTLRFLRNRIAPPARGPIDELDYLWVWVNPTRPPPKVGLQRSHVSHDGTTSHRT